jgi:hypothetical protein
VQLTSLCTGINGMLNPACLVIYIVTVTLMASGALA